MDNAAVNEYGGNRHSHTLRLGVENGTFLEGNLAMLQRFRSLYLLTQCKKFILRYTRSNFA